MMKNRLTILSAVVIVILMVFGYAGVLPGDIRIILAGGGITAMLCVLDRLEIFRKKIDLAFRHILDNNFQTGISLAGADETAVLAEKFNRVVERINAYDLMRENSVAAAQRLLTVLNRNIADAVMIFDMEFSRVKLNRAAQKIFGVNQDDLSVESLLKPETNAEFAALYEDIARDKINTAERLLELHLPVLRAKARVNMKIFAVKDKDGCLKTILCILSAVA